MCGGAARARQNRGVRTDTDTDTGIGTAPAPHRRYLIGTHRAGECSWDALEAGLGAGAGAVAGAGAGAWRARRAVRGLRRGVGAARDPPALAPPATVVCFFITGLRFAVVPRSHWLRCGDVASFAYDIETSQRSPLVPPRPRWPGAMASGTCPRCSFGGGPRGPSAPVAAGAFLSRKRGCVSPRDV